jgi:hypothetical protein
MRNWYVAFQKRKRGLRSSLTLRVTISVTTTCADRCKILKRQRGLPTRRDNEKPRQQNRWRGFVVVDDNATDLKGVR